MDMGMGTDLVTLRGKAKVKILILIISIIRMMQKIFKLDSVE